MFCFLFFFPAAPRCKALGWSGRGFFMFCFVAVFFFFYEEAPESESVSHKRPSLVCFSPFV